MDENNEKLSIQCQRNDIVTLSYGSITLMHQGRTLVAMPNLGNKRLLTSMYLPTVALCWPRPRSFSCRPFIREIRSNLRMHSFPIVRTSLSNACRFRITEGRRTRVLAPTEWFRAAVNEQNESFDAHMI
jgi:hypothetical protein